MKMRRIDLNKLPFNLNWNARAALAQQQINDGTKQPKDASLIWSEVKPSLKELSNGKCWYCESREARSDNAVDHFRPKSVYPWFTCDIKNFRYSCTFCNSIRNNPDTGESAGKGDHFPLLNGVRAHDALTRNTEDYVLIDPCVAADVGLLDFRDDGFPCAKYPKEQEVRYKRAIDSIKYYHLDHPDLNEARRQLSLQISEWVEGADAIYSEADQLDAKQQKAFSIFVESIGRAIDKGSPFSVFAKKMLKGYRTRPWVDDLLDCA